MDWSELHMGESMFGGMGEFISVFWWFIAAVVILKIIKERGESSIDKSKKKHRKR